MNYKETLFFVGQSLTINHDPENNVLIEEQLKSKSVDWEAVVKVSTAHLVLPALYCNLKRANFLHYLLEDLVNYMVHITDLNRERNRQIVAQAKEINELLLANHITPIFLKGTGNLLEGLYEDIAERMVGDMDFIVSKEEYQKTIELLLNFGYETVHKKEYYYPEFKHYPRIHKKDTKSIVAIEIHKELLTRKYAHEFNYDVVKSDTQHINNFRVLSDVNQLNLTIIAKQINDAGNDFKTISLRNAYDLFLLSQRSTAKSAIAIFHKLYEPLNNFLAVCYEVMGKISSLEYTVTNKTTLYVQIFYRQLDDTAVIREKHQRKVAKKVLYRKRVEYIILIIIFKKEFRQWMLKRATDKEWQQQMLKQLGLKK
jgi:hypothetical protein